MILMIFPSSIIAKDIEKFSTWSFQFNKMPISEAIRKVRVKTGLSISIHKDAINNNEHSFNDIITKTYTDMRLDKILTDLLKRMRCSVVWNYRDNHLEGVNIWIFNKSNYQGKDNYLSSIITEPENTPAHNNDSLNVLHEKEKKVNSNPEMVLAKNQRLKRYAPPPMPPIFSNPQFNKMAIFQKQQLSGQKIPPDRTNQEKNSKALQQKNRVHSAYFINEKDKTNKIDKHTGNSKAFDP